jgi:hypothetical protein
MVQRSAAAPVTGLQESARIPCSFEWVGGLISWAHYMVQ